MKTLLVLTLLVAIVGLGVWNSPKGESNVLFFEAELNTDGPTEFQIGADAAGKPQIHDGSGEVIPWAEYSASVKNADDVAKRGAEWAEFQSLSKDLSEPDDFSDYSPLPDEATIATYEAGDGRSAELEITK